MSTNRMVLAVLASMLVIACSSSDDNSSPASGAGGQTGLGGADGGNDATAASGGTAGASSGNGGASAGGGNAGGSSGSWTDHGGLQWSAMALDTSMSWAGAQEYCAGLGGRLPTLSELRTLIQNCAATQVGGECKAADDCLSFATCWSPKCVECTPADDGRYSAFGDTDKLWSASELSDDTGSAWVVGFELGGINNGGSKKNDSTAVRCVK